jgi:hypothetical protein
MPISTIGQNGLNAPLSLTSPVINTVTSAAATALTLQSAGTTAITVDASQNVGINQTSPTVIATAKQLAIKAPVNGDSLFVAQNSNSLTTFIAGYYGVTAGPDKPVIGSYSNDPVAFLTNNTERMRITTSGQLTAGNSGTGYGSITGGNISGFDPSGSNAYIKAAITAAGAYGGGVCVLDGTYGWVMYGLTNGADFYIRRGSSGTALSGGVYLSNGATSWSAASDERLKNIKRPITNALEKLKDYRCVIGEYKDNLGVERPFLIAQDVRATFPEAVNVMDKDEGYLGMSYADMIPLLTKSIQELKTIVDAQAAEIAELKAKVA